MNPTKIPEGYKCTNQERRAIELYDAGQKPTYSTGIGDERTAGYGKLDDCGYWEFPLPNWHVALKGTKHEKLMDAVFKCDKVKAYILSEDNNKADLQVGVTLLVDPHGPNALEVSAMSRSEEFGDTITFVTKEALKDMQMMDNQILVKTEDGRTLCMYFFKLVPMELNLK